MTSQAQERDDLLAAAMEEIDAQQPSPKPRSAPAAESPTLAQLESNRRPQARTVCERCANSVWFASPVEVRCYCRVMYLVTWSSKDPQQITACDGMFLEQD